MRGLRVSAKALRWGGAWISLAALFISSPVLPPAPRTPYQFPVLTLAGYPTSSLFSGIEPLPGRLFGLGKGAQAAGRRCPVDALSSWLQPTVASAFDCTASSCSGNYMWYETRVCDGECNSRWHYSDPPYCWICGWQYTGPACGGACCNEDICNNP